MPPYQLLLAVWASAQLVSSAAIIDTRSVQQGWSLQSSTCPSGSQACGSIACCPSDLHCNPQANDQVSACCSTSSDCRGAVENAPSCADSSWSLWQGFQGNDFCCQVGLIGVFDTSKTVAGTCVPSGQAGTSSTARLMSSGTGSPPSTTTTKATTTTTSSVTTSSTSKTSSTTAKTSPTSTKTSSSVQATGTGHVFAHYMIGSINTDHVTKDVLDAAAMGLDAFAMNVGNPTASWALDCINDLFAAAATVQGFSLFFSFDLYQDSNLQDHITLFNQYKNHPNYFIGPNGSPLVSSYGGYNEMSAWASFKSSSSIYLLPNLDDSAPGGGDTSSYYTNPSGQLSGFNSIVDGYFSWESAWPQSAGGPVNEDDTGDQNVMSYAHSNGKTYMMGLSTLQYKDCCGGNNYYRIGEVNLPERMTEILQMKPDFTEVITWNDGGESHYVGNFWNESIGGETDILAYSNDVSWPHQSWQPLITSFINAYKRGQSASQMVPPGSSPIGALWYRGVLKSSCSNAPRNSQSASDTVNYAIVVPASSTGLKINVSINNSVLSSTSTQAGLNYAAVPGLAAGTPRVDVVDASGNVLYSAIGINPVNSGNVQCNFNFNVAGLK